MVRKFSKDTRFLQCSTSELYGSTPPPQSESTPFHPRSPYGTAKLYAHWIVVNYRSAFGLHASNGIMFNHESPRRGSTFVTKKISEGVAKYLKFAAPLNLGNLDAVRDWGYAKEYVEAMWLMLQQEQPDDFVVGTGQTHSIKDFINYVSDVAGFNLMNHIIVDEKYKRPSEVPLLLADPSKAKNKLGWHAKTTAKELAEIMYKADLAKEIKNVR